MTLSAKEAEDIPCDKSSVDVIRPYIIRREGHDDPLTLKTLTMIDPATGWFKKIKYNDKPSDTIANLW